MSAPSKPRRNLYGYEVLRVRDQQPVDPVLDGKDEKPRKKSGALSAFAIMGYVVGSLLYIVCMVIAGFHSYRAYGTNDIFNYIHRMFFAVALGPLYVFYVIIKTNIHALFGLAKGADLITMTGKPYYKFI